LRDIFAHSGATYIEQHGVSTIQYKAITAISSCRTSKLGGHVLCCDHCGALDIAYNSCRYRHCPKCQALKKIRWLEERKAELLPVPYFHVVFTLPHELNPIASYNPTVIYNLLFKAAWTTVNTLGHDKKRLNGQMGMTAFLHTWNQKINQHIHLHCMVPAGALFNGDGKMQWRSTKKDYLFPVTVMSKLFGKIFLSELTQAFKNNELLFKGCITYLAEESQFMKFKLQLRPKPKTWNVYAKEPFNGAAGGVEYLARYFTKTAIGNERLLSFHAHQVTFKWRDSRNNNQTKIMTLDVHEFMRRYLSHILPHGFMRVRYFGFLANSVKAKNSALIRTLLSAHETQLTPTEHSNLENNMNQPEAKKNTESMAELMKRVVGIDITLCKRCKIGRLEKIQMIPTNHLCSLAPWDTS
jgi:Putative transposase/Transposase zinc-binding domain